MKKKIVYTYYYDGDAGEIDAFFNEKFKLLEYWSCNDALWRTEYMNPLLETLGIEVKPLPEKQWDKADKAIEDYIEGKY